MFPEGRRRFKDSRTLAHPEGLAGLEGLADLTGDGEKDGDDKRGESGEIENQNGDGDSVLLLLTAFSRKETRSVVPILDRTFGDEG